jgi:hypothetical protein
MQNIATIRLEEVDMHQKMDFTIYSGGNNYCITVFWSKYRFGANLQRRRQINVY